MNSKSSLNLTEIFSSIQGETSTSGRPCTFIRLSQCNLRCTWCDSEYSFKRGTPHSIESIVQTVEKAGFKEICVTGGEPLLQANVHKLIKELCDLEYSVQIETGGSLSTEKVDPRARVILDIKCPGSGMSQKNLMSNLDILKPHDEVKFVIKDQTDYTFAKQLIDSHQLKSKSVEILLSPVFGVLDPKDLVSWIQEDQLHYIRLNLQIHKYIWDPLTIGV